MLTDTQIITQFINGSRVLLIDSQSKKGLRASGKSANELGVNIQEEIGQLIDKAGYFYYQEFGRKPGKAPPFKAVYDWVALKKYGINFETEKQHIRITFAYMRKIKLQGSYTHQHGQTGVVSDVVSRDRINALVKSFAGAYSARAKSDIVKEFKPKN